MNDQWEVVSQEPLNSQSEGAAQSAAAAQPGGWQVVSHEPVTLPQPGQPGGSLSAIDWTQETPQLTTANNPYASESIAKEAPLMGSMLPGPLAIPGAIGGQILHDVAYPPATPGTFTSLPMDKWEGLVNDLGNWAFNGGPRPGVAQSASPVDLDMLEQGVQPQTPVDTGAYGGVPSFAEAEFERLKNAALMGTAAAAGGKLLGLAGNLSPALAGEGAGALPQFVENASPKLMNLLGQIPGAAGLVNKYKGQVGDFLAAQRNEIPQEIMGGEIPGNTAVGLDLGAAAKNITGAHGQAYSDFLQAGKIPFTNEAGESGFTSFTIPVPDAVPIAQQLLESGNVTKPTGQWLQKIVDNGEMTTTDINRALGGKKFGISGEGKYPIKDAIMQNLQDFDNAQGTQLTALRGKADDLVNNYYANWKGNDTLKAVLRTSSQNPQQTVNTMFNRANVGELQALKAQMPDDVWNASLARYLENNLSRAMPESTLSLPKLNSMWGEIGPTLKQIEPDTYSRMDAFVQTANKAGNSMPVLGKQPQGGPGIAGVSAGAAETYGMYKLYDSMKDNYGIAPALGGVLTLGLLPRALAWKMLGPAGAGTMRNLLGGAIQPAGQLGAAYGTQQFLPGQQQ